MRFIYAAYNMPHNCIDVTTYDGYVLRIDCGKAEEDMQRCILRAVYRNGCCGRFIRIVVTYLFLYRGLVKI